MDASDKPDQNFFIAEKLKGIPLVTARSNKNQQQVQQSINTLSKEQVPGNSSRNRLSSTLIDSNNQKKSLAVQQTSGSTMKKPLKTQSTTTSSISSTPKVQTSKHSQLSSSTTTVRAQTRTTRKPVKIKPINLTPKPLNSVKLGKLLKSAAASTTQASLNTQTNSLENDETDKQAEVGLKFAENPTSASAKRWSSSQLSSLPDLQRRNPQTILSAPRYTNRLGDNNRAGENWVLFNRPDGRFSAFEILVLVSNILIVSVIVVVILSNWFRSIQKKRKDKEKIDLEANKQVIDRRNDTGSPKSPLNKLAKTTKSEIVLTPSVRSPVSSRMSGLSEIVSAETAQIDRLNLGSTAESLMTTQVAQIDGTKSLDSKRVGSARKISSEIISGSTSITNKATAIVQPSENSTKISPNCSPMSGKLENRIDLVKIDIHPISRTISDLSGSAAATGTNGAKKQQVVKSESERMSLLEDAFKGSAPELSMSRSEVVAGDSIPADTARGSLESIELPKPLVDSIKQSEPAAGGKIFVDPSPSPNLLLEVNPKVADTSTAVATGIEFGSTKNGTLKKEKPENKGESEEKYVASKNRKASNPASKPTGAPKLNPPENRSKDVPKSGEKLNSETSKNQQEDKQSVPIQREANVKKHQTVVNKLDKRKTNLEIVDLRDESVIGRLRDSEATMKEDDDGTSTWISMDGVAVVQGISGADNSNPPLVSAANSSQMQQQQPIMSPSEIIESRFHVDYKTQRHKDSLDSKSEERALHSIEDELEEANKMQTRKYFVYIVQDGHFTAKKECIARIELPQKRRVTLAEMRQLIANSQDISLTSLRRNRFKFVTETYRLLNENEDAALLQQVYPTQGVFLKLNIPEQEGIMGSYSVSKAARARNSSFGTGSNLSATTISSRRRATATRAGRTVSSSRVGGDQLLPAIEVDYANSLANQEEQETAVEYGRTRAASVSRLRRAGGPTAHGPNRPPKRAKSSVQEGVTRSRREESDMLPAIGRSKISRGRPAARSGQLEQQSPQQQPIGAQMLSGAKRLFRNTFSQRR